MNIIKHKIRYTIVKRCYENKLYLLCLLCCVVLCCVVLCCVVLCCVVLCCVVLCCVVLCCVVLCCVVLYCPSQKTDNSGGRSYSKERAI